MIKRYQHDFISEIPLLKKLKTSNLMLHVIKKLMETHYLSKEQFSNSNKVLEIFRVAIQYLIVGQKALYHLVINDDELNDSTRKDSKSKKMMQFSPSKRLYSSVVNFSELSGIQMLESQMSCRKSVVKDKNFFRAGTFIDSDDEDLGKEDQVIKNFGVKFDEVPEEIDDKKSILLLF